MNEEQQAESSFMRSTRQGKELNKADRELCLIWQVVGYYIFLERDEVNDQNKFTLHLPFTLHPCNNRILHRILDTPLVALHSYFPKSSSPSGFTTRTLP